MHFEKNWKFEIFGFLRPDFWVKKIDLVLKKWKFWKWLKMHVLGQNFLKNRFSSTREPKSAQKRLFRQKIAKSHFLAIFEKRRFWQFCRCSTSTVCCPFELKIAWGLCLALKSSQKNFQLKRTAHGGGADLAKTPKSTFSEILKNRPKSEKWPKKAFLGTYGFSSVLFSIFQLILATFYDFFYLNW